MWVMTSASAMGDANRRTTRFPTSQEAHYPTAFLGGPVQSYGPLRASVKMNTRIPAAIMPVPSMLSGCPQQ
jgi:hypothetical protein